MGILWVWERTLSRRREKQLSESHDKLLQYQEHLTVLIKLVRRNTQAIERFDQTQVRLIQILEQVQHEHPEQQGCVKQGTPAGNADRTRCR